MRSCRNSPRLRPAIDLDDPAEHVGRDGCIPKLRRAGAAAAARRAPRRARPRVFSWLIGAAAWTSFWTWRGPGEAVSQARSVAHQVLDRDRPLGGTSRALAVLDPDLHLGEGGNVLGDRIGDQQPPFLDQRHRGDRDDRLGHGIDAEDRVGGHRRPAGPERAERLREADLAVPRDQHRDARRAARRDLALHRAVRRRSPALERPTSSGRAVGRPEGAVDGSCIGTSSRRSKRAHHVRNGARAARLDSSPVRRDKVSHERPRPIC